MALCLPRKRWATSLATLPSTLSVASITNHSCTTSAGFALKVVMSFLRKEGLQALFHGRCSSWKRSLLGGVHGLRHASPRGQEIAAKPGIIAGCGKAPAPPQTPDAQAPAMLGGGLRRFAQRRGHAQLARCRHHVRERR